MKRINGNGIITVLKTFSKTVYFVPLRSSRSPTLLIVFNYFRGWRGRVAGRPCKEVKTKDDIYLNHPSI